MRIYIMTDMEGVAGVLNADDYLLPGARYYEVARELVTLETNAAIEGLLDAGATEFLVVDGHGPGAINPLLLHPAARLDGPSAILLAARPASMRPSSWASTPSPTPMAAISRILARSPSKISRSTAARSARWGVTSCSPPTSACRRSWSLATARRVMRRGSWYRTSRLPASRKASGEAQPRD